MSEILSEVVEIGSNYMLIDYSNGRCGLVVSYDEYLFVVITVAKDLRQSKFGDLMVVKTSNPHGRIRITRGANYEVYIEASKLTKPKI